MKALVAEIEHRRASSQHDIVRVEAVLDRLSLALADEVVAVTRLSGGVSADVFRVDLAGRAPVCVKFPATRLRVAAAWTAPLHRAGTEHDWLLFAQAVSLGSVPEPLGHDPVAHALVTRFLDPAGYPVWKGALLAGHVDVAFAAAVGAQLAAYHAHSASEPSIGARFAHAEDFAMLRIDPYLCATAAGHPDLKPVLDALAAGLDDARIAVIHGDVSPKNLLCGPAGPVFIDAECATLGDPAFDVAFLLNHLAIKSSLPRLAQAPLPEASAAAWRGYRDAVGWEPVPRIEARVIALLPALTLARVDGASPLEYLDEDDRARLRSLARRLLLSPPASIDSLLSEYRA